MEDEMSLDSWDGLEDESCFDDLLAVRGFLSDVDDAGLGAAYNACPPEERALIKNNIALTYALVGSAPEMEESLLRAGHVRVRSRQTRLKWAFFVADEQIFPVSAIIAALTLAVAARVEGLVLCVAGTPSTMLLTACDLLSIGQVYTADKAEALTTFLPDLGQGVMVHLAGSRPVCSGMICPDPSRYGVQCACPQALGAKAYARAIPHPAGERAPYICYGPGQAPLVFSEEFLGCWVWDVLQVQTFYGYTREFF